MVECCMASAFTVINPKYWGMQAFTNSVDPDQMPNNVLSDQGLHCLLYIQQYFRHIKREQNELVQILGQVW